MMESTKDEEQLHEAAEEIRKETAAGAPTGRLAAGRSH